ncbi:MAG: EF-P lysine aminoacylase EpmA [Halioglobus sp.]
MKVHWQPGATPDVLRMRAALLATIRQFFNTGNVLEVETPLLCSSGVTEPAIAPLVVTSGQSIVSTRYLQSSPEYAMKRLLAAGSGPIYQIARAFRDGEAGGRHNPEFSMLEWYRPGFDHHELMKEVEQLLVACLGEKPVRRFSYRELFQQFVNIDPFTCSDQELANLACSAVDLNFSSAERDVWLDLILSHLIEPSLAGCGYCFVYDYPASQAALSRLVPADDVIVGQRFEVYVDGMELANGYCELTDPAEQRSRFETENRRRLTLGLPEQPVDELLLAALAAGMPDCSGVALGVDRLLMVLGGKSDIGDVLAFDWGRC